MLYGCWWCVDGNDGCVVNVSGSGYEYEVVVGVRGCSMSMRYRGKLLLWGVVVGVRCVASVINDSYVRVVSFLRPDDWYLSFPEDEYIPVLYQCLG